MEKGLKKVKSNNNSLWSENKIINAAPVFLQL